MHVFLNGRIVPEEEAVVSVFDRSFLYGDGLFETLLVRNGKPFRWNEHFERLRRGAAFLNIGLPYSSQDLLGSVHELIAHNPSLDFVARMTLSRGVGVRGYSTKGANHPVFVISLHPSPVRGGEPPQWKLVTASIVLPTNQPLAQFKTCNKLPQILARAQADEAGADEALLLNSEGAVVEGASSNLFWMEEEVVYTPPRTVGVLPGVTRAVLLEICPSLGRVTRETSIISEQLRRADGVFLSLSTIGMAEATSLDGTILGRTQFVRELWSAYWDLVQKETS